MSKPAKTGLGPGLGAAALATELRQLIDASRQRAAAAVNAELTLLYWQVGHRIGREVLGGQRAGYGDEVVATLGRQLSADYGRGFSTQNLRHMLRFAEAFPALEIVSTLSRQLAWSHFLELIYLKDPLARDFYAQMCAQEGWSVRRLRERKDSALFEHTALSRQPEAVLAQELATLREAGDLSPALELQELDESDIHVAEYLTVLPPREALQAKLQQAIASARQRLLAPPEDA